MLTIFAQELLPNVKKYNVILFGMGINNAFNQGLLYEIALNFPDVKKNENAISPYGDKRKYGTLLPTVQEGITFCACYMQNGGYRRKGDNVDSVNYEALEKCLETAAKKYKGKKICAPIIGANFYDGKGNKERILALFKRIFTECDIDIYDYDQKDFQLENYRALNETYARYKRKEITWEEYNEARRRLTWERDNGIFKPMPEDYVVRKNKNIIRVKKEYLDY